MDDLKYGEVNIESQVFQLCCLSQNTENNLKIDFNSILLVKERENIRCFKVHDSSGMWFCIFSQCHCSVTDLCLRMFSINNRGLPLWDTSWLPAGQFFSRRNNLGSVLNSIQDPDTESKSASLDCNLFIFTEYDHVQQWYVKYSLQVRMCYSY